MKKNPYLTKPDMPGNYVYVIGPDDPGMELPTPPIKIGKATSPLARLRTLQTGASVKLCIYALWECQDAKSSTAIESACHREFKAARTVGEWFNVKCDEVRRYVDANLWRYGEPILRVYGPHH